MNKIKYQTLETIGTIVWLLVDFVWMCGYTDIAILLSIVPFVTLASAFIFYNSGKRSERLGLLASWLWFFMNGLWILGDKNESWITIAKLVFGMASIAVLLAMIYSKKEKDDPNLRRLNIN